MSNQFSRRDFLRRTVFTSAGLWAAAPFVTSGLHAAAAAGEPLLHASFGAGGMAASDIDGLTRRGGAKLVAVADVDQRRAEALKLKFPDVKIYQDWRMLLDKEKSIQSVNVSVPDHMHAPIAMAALQLGKNVYCQKPLTHDIYETRQLTEVARKKKLVTQMGIQIHSSGVYRQAVAIVQSGAIGKVKEVHAFSDKKWGDSFPRPDRTDTVPESLAWDLWLGVAAERPYIGEGYYHPSNWRKRLDFGTGTSPILAGNLLILTRDQDLGSELLALDKRTGKTVWRVARPEFRRGFATPFVWQHDGQEELIVPGSLWLRKERGQSHRLSHIGP